LVLVVVVPIGVVVVPVAVHFAATIHRQLGRDPGPCLGLFRELGPCRCEQNPRLIESAVWLLGHVATVVGLRAERLREPVKLFASIIVGPITKETGPGFLRGGQGEQPGPLGVS
jgi:hypothetical protein